MNHREQFLASLILHLILPLLPVGIEIMINEWTVDNKSFVLATSMYAITTVLSSSSILQFALGLLISLFCSLSYAMGGATIPIQIPIISVVLIFIFHGLERYKLHIVLKKRYFNFE